MLTEIEIPTKCPGCSAEIETFGNSQQLRCVSDDCTPQLIRRLTHWCSRKAADIDGISGSWLEDFVAAGLVQDVADLYTLQRTDLMRFENMGDGRATNFLAAIEASKALGMRRALIGLSLPGASEGTAARLCKVFPSVQAVATADLISLVGVNDVGISVASSLHDWFRRPGSVELLTRLELAGVQLGRLDQDGPLVLSDVTGELVGKRVCVTGAVSCSRDEFHAELEQAGAIIAKSVSGKVDLLIIGKNVGAAKTNKAKQLGVTVITEETARNMMA